MMQLNELAAFRGQAAWQIETPAATYVFHREGAGFAAIFDPDGHDWIGHRPGNGSAGEYRGIPNVIHPAGGFHPGHDGCQSSAKIDGDAVVIDCRKGDHWRATWRITAAAADFEMTAIGGPHWMLYEGTPGGEYDESAATWTDSAGTVRRCNERWEGRLPEPRRVTFATPASRFALELEDRTVRPPSVLDSYWSMEQNMTVFGFGRLLDSQDPRWMHLQETPCHLRVRLVETGVATLPGSR
jgi:hypothetical protein